MRNEDMRQVRLVALMVSATCVFLILGAASALASGPLWLVKGMRFDCEKVIPPNGVYKSLLECLGGPVNPSGAKEWSPLLLTRNGRLTLDQGARTLLKGKLIIKFGSLLTIVCKNVIIHKTLVGGNPGRAHLVILKRECEVEGHPSCTVNSVGEPAGSIVYEAKGELVYLGTKEEAEKEEGKLGLLMVPEEGETFTTIEVGGSGCPLFTKGEEELQGSAIAEVTPVNATATAGKEILPATTINHGWKWISKGKVKEVTAELDAFGILEAAPSGELEGEIEGGEEWGASTK